MTARRLFTAVIPSKSAGLELEDFLDDTGITRMTREAAWVKPHRWHITTAFMPKVTHDELEGLEPLLQSVSERTVAFDLRLSAAGVFMNAGRQVPIWIGVDGDTGALGRLAEDSRRAVSRAGIRPESGKNFTPHLTVARKADRIDTSLWVERLDAFQGSPFTVDEFVLVESFTATKDKPPHYDVLAHYRFSESPSVTG